jgi:cellulose synthase/poly-beta-1,6-N-acetylglucosamine synthase-like glycosyltransferase
VLVIDDGSTDNSARILRKFGKRIDVVTIPKATGNKSLAQERGLRFITGDVFIATDGDTILDSNFVQYIEEDFQKSPDVVAVGGYVKSLKHNWLTACRELDYLIGQDLFKLAQSYIDTMFVIPGCAGAFRKDIFLKYIQFDHDTLTEDLDFTYKLHEEYFMIAYDRRAVAYTQDPGTLSEYVNQMRRWYCGGWQNLRKHYKILGKPNNALQLSMSYLEGLMFSVLIFALPILSPHSFLFFLIPYIAIVFAMGTYGAIKRKRLDLLLYAPLYLILLYIHAAVFLEQFWKEIVLRRTNLVWFHPARREI